MGDRKVADLGQLFKDRSQENAAPGYRLHPAKASCESGESWRGAPGPLISEATSACSVLLPSRCLRRACSICLWLLKMCLSFFLKIKPQSRDERKCFGARPGTHRRRWGERRAGEDDGGGEQGGAGHRPDTTPALMTPRSLKMPFDAQTE